MKLTQGKDVSGAAHEPWARRECRGGGGGGEGRERGEGGAGESAPNVFTTRLSRAGPFGGQDADSDRVLVERGQGHDNHNRASSTYSPVPSHMMKVTVACVTS